MPQPFLLGEWRVEPALKQITRLARGSVSQRITFKAMEVLLVLVARVGELITREQLLASVGSDVQVQEEVLTRAIADLRKALDDDRKDPRYIETIPKRGYRVVAQVGPVSRARRSLSLWGGFSWTFDERGPCSLVSKRGNSDCTEWSCRWERSRI